jgi:hypothetical protein
MTDLDKATQQFSPRERRTTGIAEPVAADCVVTFAVTGGIFGVGQLATRLNKLLESGKIGVWHIGPWVDWRHTAICIKFDSVEDGKLSEDVVRLDLEGARS